MGNTKRRVKPPALIPASVDGRPCLVVPLTKGKFALVDEADRHLVEGHVWSYWESRGQCCATTSRGLLKMHRLILPTSPGNQVDHANTNGLDNRRSNLREATRSQNQMNKRSGKIGRVLPKGVYRTRHGRFFSMITVDGRNRYLGTSKTQSEASAMYQAAARKFHGEFARW